LIKNVWRNEGTAPRILNTALAQGVRLPVHVAYGQQNQNGIRPATQ